MALPALESIIAKTAQGLAQYHPKTIVLFGSAARYLLGIQEQEPEDLDFLYIGNIQQIEKQACDLSVDLFFFAVDEILSIAKSLRYLPPSMARAKMYFKDTWKGYVRSDIAACLLLGPAYPEYGFLQMENEEKHRDYSVHKVLHGEHWWRALQHYARERRGTKGMAVDKVLGLDQFKAPE